MPSADHEITDDDLRLIWWCFNGIIQQPGYAPGASEMAAALRNKGAEIESSNQMILDMRDQGLVAESPNDAETIRDMAGAPYAFHDLAERIDGMTDAAAFAALLRAKERFA